jgi:hypothetical protein
MFGQRFAFSGVFNQPVTSPPFSVEVGMAVGGNSRRSAVTGNAKCPEAHDGGAGVDAHHGAGVAAEAFCGCGKTVDAITGNHSQRNAAGSALISLYAILSA